MVAFYRRLGSKLRTGSVETHEGGEAFIVDQWTLLRRFLVLGSAGGTFYVGEQKLAREHAACVTDCLNDDPDRAVAMIVDVSQSGAAPKNEPALFALALAAAHPNETTRRLALAALPNVARIGTHLFHFAAYVNEMRGWGRGLRRAVASWYQDKDLDDLAYQAIKYRQRDGWTHADLLRLAHPKSTDAARNAVYKWIVGGDVPEGASVPVVIAAFEELQRTKPTETAFIAEIIRRHRLPREAVPTAVLNDASVWEALLDDMPMTAMFRNLGTMSKVGLATAGSDAARLIVERLRDDSAIRKARVHPMAVLLALTTYQQGRGERGSSTWDPAPKIVDALDAAFYGAFANVPPTNKALLLALDVSGSMTGARIVGTSLSCIQGGAAMALITAATEPNAEIIAFDTSVHPVTISPRQRLDDVVTAMNRHGGGTRCSLPMAWAIERGFKADAIIEYTDSETRDQQCYPYLQDARRQLNPSMKGVIVAMAANSISIFPETDQGALQVAGFDASAPSVIADFVSGRV